MAEPADNRRPDSFMDMLNANAEPSTDLDSSVMVEYDDEETNQTLSLPMGTRPGVAKETALLSSSGSDYSDTDEFTIRGLVKAIVEESGVTELYGGGTPVDTAKRIFADKAIPALYSWQYFVSESIKNSEPEMPTEDEIDAQIKHKYELGRLIDRPQAIREIMLMRRSHLLNKGRESGYDYTLDATIKDLRAWQMQIYEDEGWTPGDRSLLGLMSEEGVPAVGLLGLSRLNPALGVGASAFFTHNREYREAREAGVPHEDALNSAKANAAIAGVSMAVGSEMLFRSLSKAGASVMTKIMLASGTQFADGTVEQIATMFVRELYGVENLTFTQKLARALFAGGMSTSMGNIFGTKTYLSDIKTKRALQSERGLTEVASSLLADPETGEIPTSPDEIKIRQEEFDLVRKEIKEAFVDELQIVKDASRSKAEGGPQTELGKRVKKQRVEAEKVIKAFLKGKGIESLPMSKAERAKYVSDVIAKMSDATDAEMKAAVLAESMSMDSRVRAIHKEQDALEKQGVELLDTESMKYAALDDTAKRAMWNSTPKGAIQTKIINDLNNAIKRLGPKQKEGVTSWLPMKEQDPANVAKIKSLKEELKAARKNRLEDAKQYAKDMTFDKEFAKHSEAIKISDRMVELQLELDEISLDQKVLADKAGLPEIADLLGDTRISKTLDDIVSSRSRAEINAFKKGMREQKTYDKKRVKEIQSILIGMIDNMPISAGEKSRLKNRVKGAVNAKDVVGYVDKVFRRALDISHKESIKKWSKDIKKMISTHKSEALAHGQRKGKTRLLDVNRLVDTLHKMENAYKNSGRKGSDEIADNFVDEHGVTEETMLAVRYARLKSMGDKANSLNLAEFADTLEFVIKEAYMPTPYDIARAKTIKDTIESVKLDDEVHDVDKDKLREKGIKRVAEWAKRVFGDDSAGAMLYTYNTLLDKYGLTDNKAMSVEDQQIATRSADMYWMKRLKDLQAEIGMTKQDIRDMDSDDYAETFTWTIDSEHVTSYVDKIISEGGYANRVSLNDALTVAKKYFKDVGDDDGIKSIDNIVEAMKAEDKKSGSKKTEETRAKKEATTLRWADTLRTVLQNSGGSPISRTLKLDRGQLLHRYMALKNASVRDDAQNPNGEMGYTDELIAQIEDSVLSRPKEAEFADRLFDMFAEQGDYIAPVFEKVYKIDFGRQENYVFTPRDGDDSIKRGDSIFGKNGAARDMAPRPLRERKRNLKRLKDVSILDVTERYFRETNWFIHMSEKLQDIRMITGAKDFRDSIEHRYGTKEYQRLVEHVDRMDLGVVTPYNEMAMKNVMSMVVFKALAAKGQIGLKQMSSFASYAEDMPITEFIKGVASYWKNAKRLKRELDKHSAIRNRGEHSQIEFQMLTGTKTRGFYGDKSLISEMLMKPIKWGDVGATYLGGGIYFDYLVKTKGMSKADALDAVVRKMERSQQSQLTSNLSLWQTSNSPFYRMLTMFSSSPTAQSNMMLQSLYKYSNGNITKKQLSKSLFLYGYFIPTMFDVMGKAAMGVTDEEDVDWSGVFSRNALMTGSFRGVPLAGPAIDFAATKAIEMGYDLSGLEVETYGNEYYDLARGGAGVNPISESIMYLAKEGGEALDGDAGVLDTLEAIANILGYIAKVPTENVGQIMKGMYGMEDGIDPEDMARILGYTDYSIFGEGGEDTEAKHELEGLY